MVTALIVYSILSAENQTGVNAVQQYSVENQKGDIAIDSVQW